MVAEAEDERTPNPFAEEVKQPFEEEALGDVACMEASDRAFIEDGVQEAIARPYPHVSVGQPQVFGVRFHLCTNLTTALGVVKPSV